jgi:putative FmdB family regulatory protein
MPTYEYECRECNHQFESFAWVEDRKKPEKEPCKICGGKSIKLGYNNHRIDRPHNVGGFADAMERVCQSPAVKGTKYEKELRAKHIT